MTPTDGTPVRVLSRPLVEGCRLLNEDATGSAYRDGGEGELLRLLEQADDLSSLSDELRLVARGWVQEYHLSAERANVLRALDLPADARVLEVGAGCGAVTRYLGENCRLVDALEPSLPRARVARERTRDLPGVEVLVGAVEDLPAEPAYDVVVVVGVLEHVAAGDPDPAPYLTFLQSVSDLLVHGGHLVLAIENKLGAKYLAGAPEDHTGRVYDGVEGYPRPQEAHARTFSRNELEEMVSEAGLQPRSLGAMPDYKLTRAVFAHPLPWPLRSLEWTVPQFPSPDRGLTRPQLADERLVWQSLVEAGLSQETVNSLLVVAAKGGPPTLMPVDRLAVFWNTQRRAHLATETTVRASDGRFVLERRLLVPEDERPAAASPRLAVQPSVEYVAGVDLGEVLRGCDDAQLHRWLQRWAGMLAERVDADEDVPVDLIPQNLLVTPNGSLVLIDDEWRADGWRYTDVLARGVLRLSDRLASTTPSARWRDLSTVGELTLYLGALVGLGDGWLDATIEREAHFQVQVTRVDPSHRSWTDEVARARAGLEALLAARLEDLPQGVRAFDRVPTLTAQRDALQEERDRLDEQARAAQADAARVAAQLRESEETAIRSAACQRAAAARLSGERDRLVEQVAELSQRLSRSTQLLQREETSILRPLARRAYRTARRVGSALPASTQERVRATLAPVATAVAPRSAQAAAYQQARRAVSNQAAQPAPPGSPAGAGTGAAVRKLPEPLPTLKPGAFDVIVMPVIDWHFRVQRPQHLSSHLAERGHRVIYVTTVFDEFTPEMAPYTLLEQPAPGVWTARLACPQPLPTIYRDPLLPEQTMAVSQALRTLRQELGLGHTVLIAHHPFWEPVMRACHENLLVYDLIDDHEGFDNTAAWVLDAERRLIAGADLVTVTSPTLSEKAPGAVLVRNAAEVERFAARPVEVQAYDRPTVGYFGAISHWFDTRLVESCARAHPDWQFVLIGSTFGADIAALEELPNVRFLGERPYDELPSHLHGFDVCVIPFHVIPLTEHTNPVKAYEYLAAGKPVVATAMPEVLLMQPAVRVGRTHEDFLRELEGAMAEAGDEALASQRRAWADGHTWAQRAELLERSIDSAQPTVSVIVLCYNNLALTKACLESLDRVAPYPDWELVVVDNASTDGTADYLREYAQTRPHVTLVLNDENLGFAAGNNRGLAAATGEVLVMLNNDTYVTEGWLLSLTRHLHDDPSLGLVGPVTNNIGNEAKIDLAYDDMEQMQEAARHYTSHRFRQLLRVPTVAFFCVAMRRDVFEKVGGLDEAFGVGFFEDDDYCQRVQQAGYGIAIAGDVFVHHHLSASFDALGAARKQELFEKNKAVYEAKWGEWTPHVYRAGDPA